MSKLTIIADIKANPDKVDLVKAALLKLIEPTRAEEGCINYDLHQDNENPAHFFFYENWETRELWQAHMNSAHLKAHKLATEGCIEATVVSEMTVIG
ncbi:putative quinol monooxygenase [Aliiruegeria sabulilitoris]|uniref:putative quinol monooxygenase n=1 Tax=Aliiruegeria sabulilitoris TaxID=1510458 RepID=UPI00082DC9CC|nr:putative quinol monooxygenase [Aliiruegeria sabulilitoris]NDR56261.1 antibiotic biosynthesis monooxygenase [Pseudoruegeria sp. M32A2M]